MKNICLAIVLIFMLCSCGYQLVGGTGGKGIYGGDISSVYLSVFKNSTFEPHASLYVTDAFSRELLSAGLFKLNKEDSDGFLEGNIKTISILPSAMSSVGVVVEKSMYVTAEVSLFRKNGSFIKKWTLTEYEIFRTDDINSEDYNKRDALQRLSERMARKLTSMMLVEY